MRWTSLLLLLTVLFACDSPVGRERPRAPLLQPGGQNPALAEELLDGGEQVPAKALLHEPMPLQRFETTAEALTVWRQAADSRPTLLLLSDTPHLQPVPHALRERVAALLENAGPAELAAAATDRTPDPLLLPGMAVDAALRSGNFANFVWALPLRDPDQQLSLEKFTEQLVQSGLADEAEAASLTLTGPGFAGTLRDLPFTVTPLPRLGSLAGPVVVHIDLGYFQPLYKNEVSTPLLDIVFATLATLRAMQLETLAATFSYGHQDSSIPLDVRFLGDVIAWLVEDPARFEQPIPRNWQRQRDALYLANFFQKEEIERLHRAQEQEAPSEAWIKFNLYRSAAQNKQGTQALEKFAEAVALNPLFALEYLNLSELAYERERPDEALRMLGLAAEAMPADPFIKLQMAQLANELGHRKTALHLLERLRALPWSSVYYAQMPEYLAGMTEHILAGEEASPAVQAQQADDRRSRILHSE